MNQQCFILSEFTSKALLTVHNNILTFLSKTNTNSKGAGQGQHKEKKGCRTGIFRGFLAQRPTEILQYIRNLGETLK